MQKNCITPLLWAEKSPHATFKKTPIIMKSLFFACLIGSAGLVQATNTYAQTTTVSLHVENQTVGDVLQQIENKTEFSFFYNNRHVDLNRQVSISMNETNIFKILDAVFDGTDVVYQVVDNRIVLSKRNETLPLVQQSGKKITGTVLDATGMPVIGANVMVKGTTNGTITDMDGKFTLEVDNNATLVVSYIGFSDQEIKVGNQTSLSVTLKEDAEALDELVVVGYGTQKKVNLTGAVASISSEEIESRPISNIAQALQGVSPGLNISSSASRGGEAGVGMDINIRGVGTLTSGGGTPYILVDGIPMDLNNVNPEDVVNISVLKDASSAAIYGARAAYGVILITTRRGEKNEKFRFSYSTNLAWNSPTTLPKLANSLDFANAMNEACNNSGISPIFPESSIEKIKEYQATGGKSPGVGPQPNNPDRWDDWDLTYGNTDWYDVYYKDQAFQQKHDFTFSGGGKKNSVYVGLGLLNTDGQLAFGDDNYKRYNITINNDAEITDWLKFKLNAKFTQGKKNTPIGYEGADRGVLYHMFSRCWPTLPVYSPNGTFTEGTNMVPIMENGGNSESRTSNIWITPGLEVKLLDSWMLNMDFTYNYASEQTKTQYKKVYIYGTDGITKYLHHANNFSQLNKTMSEKEFITGNVYSTYEKTFNSHYLKLLVGSQIEYNKGHTINGWKRDLLTDDLSSVSIATGDKDFGDAYDEWATVGFFARFNYSFKDKYLVELNGRYDGSSRFRTGKQWGFFPSVSVGYTISNEDYWSELSDIVNSLKIRASYGTLGNQNVPNYLHLATLPINTQLNWIMNGERPIYVGAPGLISRNLTWETAKSFNIGTDFAVLDNRLSASFDYFIRKTIDMFGPGEAKPSILGTAVPQENNASLKTQGFELSINWRHAVNKDFDYQIQGTLSDNRTKVTEYNNPTQYLGTYYEGQEIGEIWGYETAGFFTSDEEVKNWADQSDIYSKWGKGDIKYVDLNHDGKINWGEDTKKNSGDKKVIGNSTPRFLFGLNTTIRYKDFDFGMLWQGVAKRDVALGSTLFWGFQQNKFFSNAFEHTLDYWKEDNQNAYYPRPYMSGENTKNQQIQTKYLQNAAYVRLKNLQIGYNVPTTFTNKIKLDRLRIYLSGENLLTFSPLISGIDPEATGGVYGDGKNYPLSRVISVGLNVVF